MSQREELFERKRRAMGLMDAGVPWQEANEQSGLNYSQSGIQRLYREWRKGGDEALIDHRHGHPSKATSDVREWMVEHCDESSEVPASRLKVEIEAQFGVELTVQYITVLRHQLGLPVPKPGHPSKQQEIEPSPETEKELEGDFSPSR